MRFLIDGKRKEIGKVLTVDQEEKKMAAEWIPFRGFEDKMDLFFYIRFLLLVNVVGESDRLGLRFVTSQSFSLSYSFCQFHHYYYYYLWPTISDGGR